LLSLFEWDLNICLLIWLNVFLVSDVLAVPGSQYSLESASVYFSDAMQARTDSDVLRIVMIMLPSQSGCEWWLCIGTSEHCVVNAERVL